MLYASFISLIVGILFAFMFFLGERYGFLPVIIIQDLVWGKSGEAVVVFVIAFITCVFTGSLIVLFIIRNRMMY